MRIERIENESEIWEQKMMRSFVFLELGVRVHLMGQRWVISVVGEKCRLVRSVGGEKDGGDFPDECK